VGLRRDLLIVAVAIATAFALGLFINNRMGGGTTSFLDLRVLNDTHRTVTVRSCWDLDCYNTRGFRPIVIGPGRSGHQAGEFAIDRGQELALAIGKPDAKSQRFSLCLTTWIAAGQKTGLVRISQAQPCLNVQEGSAGGAG
jgi:hypothetical protein